MTMRHALYVPLLLSLSLSFSKQAAGAEPEPFEVARAVDSATLERARGGFIGPDGLIVTLGLERLVTLNGNVIERSRIDLGDLGKLMRGEAQMAPEALGQLRLIQNGSVRTLAGAGPGLLGGTLIQNTLNDQTIGNQTAINATVNTAGMLRALNFGTSLNNALTTAVAPR
jgi:hypothetical protein